MKQDEKKGSSPVPGAFKDELKNQELLVIEEQTLMSFGDVLKMLTTDVKAITDGDVRARRIGWLEQGAPEDYITRRGGQLHISTKGKMHTLVVGDGDITNEDWVLI